MAATFEVVQRFNLKAEDVQGTGGLLRSLTDVSLDAFKKSAWAKRHGVYIFGLTVQKVPKPWYVGLAKGTTLGSEAVSKDKLRKYAAAMMGRTGTPHLTLVVAPSKGPKNAAIGDLETLLIWIAQARNPDLVNERKIDTSPHEIIELLNRLHIPGVLNSGKGKPSNAAKDFSKLMGL